MISLDQSGCYVYDILTVVNEKEEVIGVLGRTSWPAGRRRDATFEGF